MIYMDKIRCSADVRSKMSRWARGLCHHESGLQDQLRPVCPIVRASTSLPERDLSQGWGVGLASGHLVPAALASRSGGQEGGQRFGRSGGAMLGPEAIRWSLTSPLGGLFMGRGGN